MPRLVYIHNIVWSVAKALFVAIYTMSVLCACVATVLMNVMLAGNAGGIVSSYALIGVMIMCWWVLWPREKKDV